MAITTKLRQGVLNPNPEEGISVTVFINGTDLLIDDSLVEYSSITVVEGLRKKLLVTYNTVYEGAVTNNLVYDSGVSEVGNTQWTYKKFRDGWYSIFLFAMDARVNTLSAVPLTTGDIVYYENSANNPLNVDTAFYVYTGPPTTFTGAILKSNTNFKLAEYSDWLNYTNVIDKGSSTGAFGAQQSFVVYQTAICRDRVLLETLHKHKGYCEACDLNDYNHIDIKIEGAELNFKRESFINAQDIIQTVIDICEDSNCNKC